ncbi:A24 family peptidase [Hyphobacterium sp. HN65]|uniref:Prepilin leader peptidase/N-methyltransferase n=1 Tax=Hyphobacterium lacteum TaxID=3116575 RepID=A0ABU7LNS0_9PROT|nr:A24 family peptidase [Hyphobacterium sp. HN65]MEE2525557.1 A24 family peptidase [Hyphobacterium sp. HN65]
MIGPFLDVFLIAAGPFIGSFITASSRAWPDWRQIALGRSACSECGHRLRPWELIPVVSFFLQKGKCRKCGAPIWPLHPVGEIVALIIPLIAVLAFDGGWTLAASLFGWVLLFGALVDLRTFLLPDVVTLGLVPPGLALAFLSGGPGGFLEHLLAALLGFATLAGIAWLYRRLRGREGLGMGDAKLLAAGGAWAGPFALAWSVAIGAGVTLFIVSIAQLLGSKTEAETPVPLGPGLAAGCYLAYCLPSLVQTTAG